VDRIINAVNKLNATIEHVAAVAGDLRPGRARKKDPMVSLTPSL
jgi:hypothetical protein